MSVSVGTLIVDLQANTASFVSGMDKAGQIALTSSKNIQRAFSAIGTGILTVLGSAETALAALVDRAIEGAANLYDLSQATGTSVAALSALDYVAKQSGISQEAMAKALEKMSKSMFAAASAPATATNAYKTLGVAVVDATGKLRPTQDVLVDLAQKFSTMQDGPAKTALAMQLFGRAGAEMVPLLNRGKAGITDLMDEAKKLGIVIDDDTAAAAKQFEESMNKLSASATGVANRLMKELLPSFQIIVDNITAGAAESQSRFAAVLEFAGFVGKAFIVGFSAIQTFFDSLGEEVRHWAADSVLAVTGFARAADEALHGHGATALQTLKDTNALMEAEDKASAQKQLDIWKGYGQGVADFWKAQNKNVMAPKPTGEAPAPEKTDKGDFAAKIQERIDKLVAQANAEGKLAQAISLSTSETIKATAAAEAEKTIEDLNLEGKKHHIQLTEQQKATIESATLRLLAYKEALNVNKELEQAITKTNEQVLAQTALAAAYSHGAEAIVAAEEKAQLGKYTHDVDQLQQAYDDMTKSGNFSAAQLLVLGNALDQARTKLALETAAVRAETIAKEAVAGAKWDHQLGIENALLQQQITATLGGAQALKQYAIAKQLAAFKEANPFATPEQMAQLENELKQQMTLENQLAAASKVHSLEKFKDIAQEIADLQKLRAQIVANGGDTMAVDAAIHEDQLAQINGYTELLDKSESYANGAIAALRRLGTETKTDAQQMDDLLTHAADGFMNTLNDAIVKGKANWADLANSIETDLLKMAEQGLMKQILGGLMGTNDNSDSGGGLSSLLGGLFGGGKAGGGDVDPGKFYVVGEHGPELLAPRSAGTVLPNGSSAGGSKSLHINNTTVIQGQMNADTFRRSQSQIEADMYRRANATHQRYWS